MKKFKVRINEELIYVNEEVYITYYKMRRRERYLNEVSLKKDLSYNQLMDSGYSIEGKMSNPQRYIEDEIIEKIMIEKMNIGIKSLTINERIIINELFFNEMTETKLANLMKIPISTLRYKKNEIINRLKKIIEK